MAVAVAGGGGDGLADLGFAQGVRTAGADGRAVGLPGVGDGAQAVRVQQAVAGGEQLALGGGAGDADPAAGRVVALLARSWHVRKRRK
mgnify:CR=1 FL=1